MDKFKFKLGESVKDLQTGMTGVVVARSEYLYSEVLYWVQFPDFAIGKTPPNDWFSERRLEGIL